MSANILDIARELARFRKLQKTSQGTVAKLLDTTQSHVSGIERGEFDSRISTIQDYARALNLELVLVPRSMLRTVQALVLDQQSEEVAPPRFYARPD